MEVDDLSRELVTPLLSGLGLAASRAAQAAFSTRNRASSAPLLAKNPWGPNGFRPLNSDPPAEQLPRRHPSTVSHQSLGGLA